MNGDTRKRKVSYRRAAWANQNDFPEELQYYLKSALEQLKSTESRTVSYGETEAQGAHAIDKELVLHSGAKRIVTLVHIAMYEPGGKANSIGKPSTNHVAGNVDAEDPPEDKDWIDGDLFMLITGNHVLTCASNIRDTQGTKYITSLLEKSGNDLSNWIYFEQIGNANKLEIINREGVSKIELNAVLYEATLDYFKSTAKKTLFSNIVSAINQFFSEDKTHKDIERDENITGKIIISFDGRKKGGELGLDRMSKLGKNLVQEESLSDYSIVTREGKRISLHEIQLRRDLVLKKHGKSVDRDDAWDKLALYYVELEQDGLMVQ